jgi:hypothetical protein
MMEAARTSEASVDNYFTRQYIPEDKSELHTHRRENLKSHKLKSYYVKLLLKNYNVWVSVGHSPNLKNKNWTCLRGKYCEEFMVQYKTVISGEPDTTHELHTL